MLDDADELVLVSTPIRLEQVPGILAKNVCVPDATEVTGANNAAPYYDKAVVVGIFLGLVDAFPGGEEPDLSLADDLDADIPAFDAPNRTPTISENADLRYIHGVPVE